MIFYFLFWLHFPSQGSSRTRQLVFFSNLTQIHTTMVLLFLFFCQIWRKITLLWCCVLGLGGAENEKCWLSAVRFAEISDKMIQLYPDICSGIKKKLIIWGSIGQDSVYFPLPGRPITVQKRLKRFKRRLGVLNLFLTAKIWVQNFERTSNAFHC